MLKDQLDVLNESYKPHSISFNLVNISRTTDANWANDGAEIEMKKSLRKGGYDSLNVYYLKNLGGGNLGVSDCIISAGGWGTGANILQDS